MPVVGVCPCLTRRTTVGFGGVRGAISSTYRDHIESLSLVTAEIVDCVACPRLVAWREKVARDKRASFAGEEYWGRPVPGFGDPAARLLVVGLAPAAHGGNRTGRVFTGDRSGDWLFRAMHRTGFANQPTSVHADDGLRLTGAYVAAAVRCAPPDNKPTIVERDTCLPYLQREWALLRDVRVVVVLGSFAYQVVASMTGLRPRPKFGHGVEAALPPGPSAERGRTLLCSFHPSQQNTFTGKLTEPMFDAIFQRARRLCDA
ncbi:MAG: uracil-DNA glycosylase [Actinomycetota bacterium]|nr:uracil-DNA glycosylase [Actinomycetota bacterium]